MRTAFTFSIALAMCGALLFAPHHRRSGELFRSCTLAEIYSDLLGAISERPARRPVFASLAIAGFLTCLFPPVLALMVRFGPPQQHRAGGAFFVLCGLVGLAGAAANLIAMLVSHMSFGFGVSESSSKDQTIFLALIALVQVATALVSVAIGASATCASFAHRLVVGA
jgi:hypothetical protein